MGQLLMEGKVPHYEEWCGNFVCLYNGVFCGKYSHSGLKILTSKVKSLLDIAPIYLVGCVIQKRICWIPGITDVLSNDNQDHKIKLLVENKQIALNREDEEQCNFDYKGEIILRKNNFGFLKTKVIKIRLSINGALLSIPQFKSWWRFVFNEVNDWFHN